MASQPRLAVTLSCAALLSLGAAALPAPAGAGSLPAASPQDLAAQRQAVHDLRNVGTAMWRWYEEVVARLPPNSQPSGPNAAVEKGRVDLTAVPVISRNDLAKLLVPKFIAAIPELDPWGRPYEYRLNTENPHPHSVMALRTGGRNGLNDGTVYPVAGFPSDDMDQDLVWIDGYFARWPQL